MSDQFELNLDEDLIAHLARLYQEASGRDIKGLSKLVAKFCLHKQLKPSLDVFARCDMFRALDATALPA